MGVVDAVLQEMERRLRVKLRIQRNTEAGFCQREAKQLTLAWAVFDQENGGMRHHIWRTSAGNVPGSKIISEMI